MKALCPICNTWGYLEKRKNSYRIKHYQTYRNGRRIYINHRIPPSLISKIKIATNSNHSDNNLSMGINFKNGNQSMGIKTLNSGFNQEKLRGRRLAWSRLRASGVRDPGSNPGDPTMFKSVPRGC